MNTTQQGFFSRIGNLFRKNNTTDGNGEVIESTALPVLHEGEHMSGEGETRSTFFRPWAKRDAAISNLQEGFNTLADLMGTVRDNLEKSNQRQAELLGYLSHLPQALQAIPESNRVQGEALHAILQQVEGQTTQQKKLSEILERLAETGTAQEEDLGALRDRLDALNQHDVNITENLNHVGVAMQTLGKSSTTSTQVLEQLRDNINSRDGELERVLHRQGARFTTLLAVAIFLSIAALAAVAVLGYLGYEAIQRVH